MNSGALERIETARKALELARRCADPRALAAACTAQTYAFWGVLEHRKERWPRMIDEARDAAQAASDDYLMVVSELFAATESLEAGKVEQSALLAGQLEERARHLNSTFVEYALSLRAVSLAIFRGIPDAEALIADANRIGNEVLPEWAAQVQFGQQIVRAWEQGRPEELAEHLDSIASSRLPEASLLILAAFTWAHAGKRERAEPLYARARRMTLLPNNLQLSLLCFLAELAAWLGDQTEAERSYARLVPFQDYLLVTGTTTTLPGIVGYTLGKLAHCLGEVDAARGHFNTARDLAARLESPPWVQRCDLALTRLTAAYRPGGPLRARC
jgi:hypothetical protein